MRVSDGLVIAGVAAMLSLAASQGVAQSVTLGTARTINLDGKGLPSVEFPDGHLAVSWSGARKAAQIFWAENQSYGSFGASIEDSASAYPTLGSPPVAGRWGSHPSTAGDRSHPDQFDNSGSWLMSVFRVDVGTFDINPDSKHLIGFYHAEDHWYADTDVAGQALSAYYHDPLAWLGIGLVTSDDDGLTWTKHGMVIGVPDLKPRFNTARYDQTRVDRGQGPWGGIGNQVTVLDRHSSPSHPAWVTLFPMINSDGLSRGYGIGAARSRDPNGSDGTWYSYYKGSFRLQQRTNEGKNSSLPGLEATSGAQGDFALSNPSVHWNTYLGRWVLVAGTWDLKRIMISYSKGASITGGWSTPVPIYTAPSGETVRYPTLVGTDSDGRQNDTEMGSSASLYWAQFGTRRAMMAASAQFAK